MLIGTVDRDEDEYENADDENAAISIDVCYFIVGGNDAAKTFDLHPLRHEIIAVRELDRETRSEYVLVVKATEQCIPDNDQDEAIEFDPSDDSLLQVKTRLRDFSQFENVYCKALRKIGILTTDYNFFAHCTNKPFVQY